MHAYACMCDTVGLTCGAVALWRSRMSSNLAKFECPELNETSRAAPISDRCELNTHDPQSSNPDGDWHRGCFVSH